MNGRPQDHCLSVEGLELCHGPDALGVGLSVAIRSGQRVVLTGASGSGKSTALRTIVGLEVQAAGTVRLDGRTPDAVGWTRFRSQVAYVQQSPGLFPGSVRDNLCRASRYAVRGGERFDETRARRLMAAVGIEACWSRRAQDLSGGEKTRLGLVRGLLSRPAFVLADEPSAGLDASTAARVAALLMEECAEGLGLLVVSHDARLVGLLDATAVTLREPGDAPVVGAVS